MIKNLRKYEGIKDVIAILLYYIMLYVIVKKSNCQSAAFPTYN